MATARCNSLDVICDFCFSDVTAVITKRLVVRVMVEDDVCDGGELISGAKKVTRVCVVML